MKKAIKISALIAAAAMAIWSCGKDDPVTPVSPSTPANTAPKAITLSSSAFTPAQGGEALTLTATTPFKPSFTGVPSWITIKDEKFDSSKYTYSCSMVVAENTTYDERSATITVSATGVSSVTFKVTQEGAEKPEEQEVEIKTSLVTENVMEKTQALYDFLYANYGKRTVSAVMADVNWNNKIAEQINTKTGKYPAMNCYDFIHIYVPEGNGWIDYSDISPVTSWYGAGGIVSLMWHFNVPKTKDTTPDKSGNGVTCTPSETTFKASNALTSGTWEYEWFYGQMEKVADVILQLQAKGIPAIWRPFHEAAGNSTYKQSASWATAWFWWGSEGADTFKKLWIAMFDYFKTKGINNLIWVWTSQNYNGDSTRYNQDTGWYPGDAYVDIVARDLYGYTASQNAQEFNELQQAYPKNMVTLGECGWADDGDTPFADVSAFWGDGAKWSWFMPWYYSGFTMVSESWWTSAFGQSSVITRSDVSY